MPPPPTWPARWRGWTASWRAAASWRATGGGGGGGLLRARAWRARACSDGPVQRRGPPLFPPASPSTPPAARRPARLPPKVHRGRPAGVSHGRPLRRRVRRHLPLRPQPRGGPPPPAGLDARRPPAARARRRVAGAARRGREGTGSVLRQPLPSAGGARPRAPLPQQPPRPLGNLPPTHTLASTCTCTSTPQPPAARWRTPSTSMRRAAATTQTCSRSTPAVRGGGLGLGLC
jgi:hypothetical protein